MGTAAQNGVEYVGILEEYQGWWGRGMELHEYLLRMPQRILEPMQMDGQHQRLLNRWESLKDPESKDIDEDDLARLRAWIRDSETLINYIVYERRPPGSTTPSTKKRARPTQIQSIEDAVGVQEDWHWPWIEGWDDPAKRARILNPPKEKNTLKKVLIVGGIATAAVIIGKKVLE